MDFIEEAGEEKEKTMAEERKDTEEVDLDPGFITLFVWIGGFSVFAVIAGILYLVTLLSG